MGRRVEDRSGGLRHPLLFALNPALNKFRQILDVQLPVSSKGRDTNGCFLVIQPAVESVDGFEKSAVFGIAERGVGGPEQTLSFEGGIIRGVVGRVGQNELIQIGLTRDIHEEHTDGCYTDVVKSGQQGFDEH